jgi:hypothetical protein
MTELRLAGDRGFADHGWLKSYKCCCSICPGKDAMILPPKV